MKPAIVDSGFIYAILDTDDEHHVKALSLINERQWLFYTPHETLVEVFHLKLHRKRKHTTEEQRIRSFARGLIEVFSELPFEFQDLTPSDLRRAADILNKYADSGVE